MELKNYQRRVLGNLRDYARVYAKCGDARRAYHEYLLADGISEEGARYTYHDVLCVTGRDATVPKVCIKVPTGGGKTYIAANAISVIADELPERRGNVVVWLVPRKEILRQTLRRLRDPGDPLRIALDRDFSHRLEVLDKEAGLRGTGFNATTVDEQLTLFVLSYDSFKNRDGRRAYQENAALAQLTSHQRAAGTAVGVEGADDTALITALASSTPIVVVDESHHARSALSVEMLKNLNPRFVLELTATPTADANVISRVTAAELKREQMVKLPVVVYRRSTKSDVLHDAVLLRRRLEAIARDAEAMGGRYIRPIALLQAEPRGDEDNETYLRLRDKLVGAGITREHIAIRTGDVDELKDTDLLARSCPIRYVITVEALSEGWDCPFAYVLATVANKSSRTSVEQIVGRILRQPYVTRSEERCLNISYVLTSAPNINDTIDQVIAGLNGSGFSKDDVKAPEGEKEPHGSAQRSLFDPVEGESDDTEAAHMDSEDDFDLDLSDTDDGSLPDGQDDGRRDIIDDIIGSADDADKNYDAGDGSGEDDQTGGKTGLGDDMDGYRIRTEFEGDLGALRLKQFVTRQDAGLFTLEFDGGNETFKWKTLLADFDLRKCGIEGISYDSAGFERARMVDVDEGDVYKSRYLDEERAATLRRIYDRYSPEGKRAAIVAGVVNAMPAKFRKTYGEAQLKDYVGRIVEHMSAEQMDGCFDSPVRYARSIQAAIERMSSAYCHDRFMVRLDAGSVFLEEKYQFPRAFRTARPLSKYDGMLYEVEDADLNDLEEDMAEALANCSNIRWWHRIVERRKGEFYINGFINHFPDFVAMTRRGLICMIETKGEVYKNDDSKLKLELGKKWADLAGDKYRYFMVFRRDPLAGAYDFARFRAHILTQL